MTTTTGAGSSTAEGETEFRHSTITVGDSALHVIDAGPDDGPAVVFLHGWPQSSAAWRLVMRRAVAEGYRAVALDLPGVGGSTGEATDGSTAAIAAVVHDLLGTLALENITLVGHDLGGMTAYSYLRRFDDAAPRFRVGSGTLGGVGVTGTRRRGHAANEFPDHAPPGGYASPSRDS